MLEESIAKHGETKGKNKREEKNRMKGKDREKGKWGRFGEICQHQPRRKVVLVWTGCGGAHMEHSSPAGNVTRMPFRH